MDAVQQSNHLENYCVEHTPINLVLRINEPPHSAWFSAAAYLEPEAAACGIKRFYIAVTVGLINDNATFPCFLTIDPSSYRALLQMGSGWEELIAQSIQAIIYGFPLFAELLRQRT